MIEVRYGENNEMADLAGKSVAEVRKQYSEQFGIPKGAQVKIGDKVVDRRHEAETWLCDDDEISFVRKSHKGLLFIGAALLAMAITGSVFAYGATSASVSLTLTDATSDFAAITAATPPTWNVFGSYKGQVATGDLFSITPATNWTGDCSVIVTLANAHDLSEAYRMLVLEIEVQDSLDNSIGTTEYLTLANGAVDIDVTNDTDTPWAVAITDGFYITHKGGWTTGQEDPVIYCQVLQRGT